MPEEGSNHHRSHCVDKDSALRSQKGGFCDKHMEFCPIHKDYFHYRGQACDRCNDAEKRRINKERKKKEEALERKQEEQTNEFFTRSKPDRKPRHDKDGKDGAGQQA